MSRYAKSVWLGKLVACVLVAKVKQMFNPSLCDLSWINWNTFRTTWFNDSQSVFIGVFVS